VGTQQVFFSSKHKECEAKFEKGKTDYTSILLNSITTTEDFNLTKEKLNKISSEAYLIKGVQDKLSLISNNRAVETFLEDGVLSREEESRLVEFQQNFGLSQDVLNKHGAMTKVSMAAILREITEGKIPESRIEVKGTLPFLFQKSETLLMVFTNVEFYEQNTRTEFVGGSQGLSIKVAKGVYYRTSAFKGKPVKHAEMKFISSGILALTTKHIYFNGGTKSFKIPFTKMVSLEPYEDGVGVQKDGVSSKPQIFKNIDGWFIFNAISNLNQL